MAKKRKDTPNRYRNLREDASIASAQKSIAKEMGLPPDSVRLVLRTGRKARTDATVGALRKSHKAK